MDCDSELIPDSSTDPINPLLVYQWREVKLPLLLTGQGGAPKWKGYAILSEEDLLELRRMQESDAVCDCA